MISVICQQKLIILRLEQVHNRITALTALNGDLDGLMRRRETVLQWCNESKKTIADVKERHAKLRPEAAQHDINQLVDIKQLITEKQGQVDEIETLLMSLAPESSDVVTEMRNQLSSLYDETSDVLDKKMDRQNIVEEYRMQLQEFYTWLDSLVKRSENADRGHGLDIAQRVVKFEELTADSHQGKTKLAALSAKVCCTPGLREFQLLTNVVFTRRRSRFLAF